jgi:hypothetical protein
MRHESSTVIALVGRLPAGLLAELTESGNVSVVRAGGSDPSGAASPTRRDGPQSPGGPQGPGRPPATKNGSAAPEPPPLASWGPGARALREAARRRATYVVVATDPLAGVASAWRSMWDVTSGPGSASGFEEQAADTLAAWHGKQFELPDYYLVAAAPDDTDTGPDLYLGPLRAARPRRVAVTGTGDRSAGPGSAPAMTASLLDTLRSLKHGPWWPPLDELIDAARRFHAGGLAETQQARYS